MRYETMRLEVPRQQTGEALLQLYLLDSLEFAPERLRPMILVLPGGGYTRRSDREKEPIVMKFLSMGFHACVLEYSVAPNRFPVAVRELALAIAAIREHADEWHVKADAVIPCGFSAGGHLACSIGTFWNRPEVYEAVGKAPESVRPDGLILSYPVITSGEYRHEGSIVSLLGNDASQEELDLVSLEKQVTENMPPVFFWHTVTDRTVPVENSLLLASALRRSGVNFEMHIYPSGVHGIALGTEETSGSDHYALEPCCQSWISLVQSWIEEKFVQR